MRPILFHWRGLRVWSYPAFLYIGLVLGVFAGDAAARAEGTDARGVFEATFLLLVPALLGARLLFVATHWGEYRRNLRRVFARSEGGAAQYGALVIILPLSVPVTSLLGVALGEFWDAATFTILVGMFFTRIGCLLNGCCSGRSVRHWGVRLPNHAGVWDRRVPTQVLEALLSAVLLAGAVSVWPHRLFAGAVFLGAAASYALGRLGLETLRERPAASRRLTIHHVLSLVLIVTCGAVLAHRWP
jgi:phosphatidylglycerol:prolipoprotein diacylglycerol transferase